METATAGKKVWEAHDRYGWGWGVSCTADGQPVYNDTSAPWSTWAAACDYAEHRNAGLSHEEAWTKASKWGYTR